ncbi:hypothetical protein OIU79_005866 [Salix purpurea]|uniref:Uncharacterized protein n=1 Tax=Salix purpurea TaxID=77065 RepID=A0A9Q0TU45_SALPP|nr:hypothetical protein OIU79_005866 [Salix purpurea]
MKNPNLPVIVEVGNRLTNSAAHPLQLLFSRESFEKTKAAKEHVIAGWEPKLGRARDWVHRDLPFDGNGTTPDGRSHGFQVNGSN